MLAEGVRVAVREDDAPCMRQPEAVAQARVVPPIRENEVTWFREAS